LPGQNPHAFQAEGKMASRVSGIAGFASAGLPRSSGRWYWGRGGKSSETFCVRRVNEVSGRLKNI